MSHSQEAGFTLVEVVVTMVLSVIMLAAILQIQYNASRLSTIQSQNSTASNLAYNNLRKYVNDSAPNWFTCTISGGQVQAMTLIDETGDVDDLPSPVTQKVVATAPYLCGGDTTGLGMPIRVESTVTYGNGEGSVTHVSYASF